MNGKFRKTGFGDDPLAQPTPGQRLAAAREAQGQSVEDVVRHTKLSRRQVMALESDAHDQLPGPVFVRGFMRNYARHLRLDPAPLLAALDAKPAPAVIPSGNVIEPGDGRPAAEELLSERASEAAGEFASESIRASISDPIAAPVIERDSTAQFVVEQGAEPAMHKFSDAAPESARPAQDAPTAGPDTLTKPASLSADASTDMPTRAAVAGSNASGAAAADGTLPDSPAQSVDNLDGIIADTSKAWRNYALVSLAVVIGLLALVLVTQT